MLEARKIDFCEIGSTRQSPKVSFYTFCACDVGWKRYFDALFGSLTLNIPLFPSSVAVNLSATKCSTAFKLILPIQYSSRTARRNPISNHTWPMAGSHRRRKGWCWGRLGYYSRESYIALIQKLFYFQMSGSFGTRVSLVFAGVPSSGYPLLG